MKPNQTKKIKVIVIQLFSAYYFLCEILTPIKLLLDKITQQGLISYVLTYLIIGIPIFTGTLLLNKTISIFKSLGLSSSISTALWTSLLFTLPMFIGGLLLFKFNQHIDIEN